MAIDVYRCGHCGREVLVRIVAPLTEDQIRRRVEEEMRPESSGARGTRTLADRLRDDIWLGVSGTRTPIPREAAPEACPTCGQRALSVDRTLEE